VTGGHHLPPARPHLKVTEDGRRVREVLTYSRRGSRLSTSQQQTWDAYAEAWVIPDEAVEPVDFSLAEWFGRDAPLVVEIGGGIGEATAALAATRPDCNFLALEVWLPGVAEGLGRVGKAGLSNVRFCSVDAVWLFDQRIAEGSVHELMTFFPDPWPKARHHKRRLVTPPHAALLASRLEVGATWHLATDWAEYAEQMVEVLDAEPLLTGGVVERWDERPLTKFERKGIRAERPITDLAYRRI